MLVGRRRRGPTAAVEPQRRGDRRKSGAGRCEARGDHVAIARGWVLLITAGPPGTPFAAMQSPTLKAVSAGCAITSVIAAGVDQITLTHGCGTPAGVVNAHPTTVDWAAIVAIGMPLTSTLAFGLVVITVPPWGHIATAPA
jgi:hypothetical protein